MGSGHGTGGRPRAGCSSNWNTVLRIAAVVVICHLLSVIAFSAQSTAAGGPLILFPLAILWQKHGAQEQSYMDPHPSTQAEREEIAVTDASLLDNEDEGNQTGKTESEKQLEGSNLEGSNSDSVTQQNSSSGQMKGSGRSKSGQSSEQQAVQQKPERAKRQKGRLSKGQQKFPASKANVMPNPLRLPTLPKLPSPPLPPLKETNGDDSKKQAAGEEDGPKLGKQELLAQLKGRRQEVERLMAKRRAEREGISVAEAERTQTDQAKEAVDVAVLAVEKPQENVKEAFSGGQNGRFVPAPKIFYNLFRKDTRPQEDKSWLDRVTDSIIDRLELQWEDSEEARMEEDSEPLMNVKLQRDSNPVVTQKPGQKLWPADECASVLKIPKVAMMFLTKGDLYHSATWQLWLEFAEGFLPMGSVKEACKTPQLLERARKSCKRMSGPPGEVTLANQHLYNVYIHVGLNNQEFKGYPSDSLWHGRDIVDRVQVEWGRHSLVTATRNMMKQALQEPLNKKFILLSEAGIPLYPPTALYHQLMSEEKSRINSCTEPGWERHTHRWTDKMETPQMRGQHWRKSSQWFGLNREHVELVMGDAMVNKAFHDHCYPTTEDGWWRDCFSDEHYFATLLAVLGRENETDCRGFMTHVDWTRGGAHPRTYEQREISAARLRLLRMPTENCGYPSAIKTASFQFIKQEDLNASSCAMEVPEYSKSLGPQCPLFARKFAPETAPAIAALISECKNRLKIVHGNECHRRLALLKKYL